MRNGWVWLAEPEVANIPDIKTISRMLQEFWQSLPAKVFSLVVRILLIVVIFFIGVQLIKLLRTLLKKYMKKVDADVGAIQFVDSFVSASLHVVLIFTIAVSFGVDAASIVALLGSAGVAIGLALQGGLSNLVGGLLILLLKPFKVGDYIMDNEGHDGTVDKIQIFYTTLLTPDNKTVVLPNGNLANNPVTNFTSAQIRRLDVSLSISYSSDIRKAKEVLLEILEEDEAVLKDHDRLVVVDALADSSVNLIVRCWLANEDYWPGKWRITERCKYVLDENGIEIPFPQMDVHMKRP